MSSPSLKSPDVEGRRTVKTGRSYRNPIDRCFDCFQFLSSFFWRGFAANVVHQAAALQSGGKMAPDRRQGVEPAWLALLREAEAAEMLRISPRTLQRLRYEGGGPVFIKVGEARVVYRQRDIEAWLEGRAATSTSSGAR